MQNPVAAPVLDDITLLEGTMIIDIPCFGSGHIGVIKKISSMCMSNVYDIKVDDKVVIRRSPSQSFLGTVTRKLGERDVIFDRYLIMPRHIQASIERRKS